MKSANCKPSQHQPRLMELKEKAKPMEQSKFDAITKAITRWIAMNGRPTNIVTDEGLKDVIRIASSNRSYKLPSRPVIDSCLDDLFNSEKDKIRVRLNNAVHVALTADYWSSLANDSYLGVTGHTIDNSWSLHSFALAVYHVEDRHYSTPQRTLYLNKTDVVVKMTCIGKFIGKWDGAIINLATNRD